MPRIAGKKPKMSSKETILKHISRSELETAIEQWMLVLSHTDPVYSDVLGFSGRINNLNTDKNRGVIDFKEETITRNQIMAAMLDTLNRWQPGCQAAPIYQAVDQLGIEKDTEIDAAHLVNCDRTKPAKVFRRAFGTRKNIEHFQFYFLCGCPNEMPGSFAKRLIYSIIKDHLDGRERSINFPFQEGADRIRTEELPLGDDLESSKKRFKAYVAKRFKFSDTQTFEAFIETGVPKLEEDFVTAIFEVSDKKWEGDEGEIRDYFNWMMETFRTAHAAVPTFLFFIVVRSNHLWNENARNSRQTAILQEIAALCTAHPAFATCMDDFPPVDAQDFTDWLAELGVRNPNYASRVLEALVQSLKPQERQMFDAENRIHMKDIEIVQKLIYEKATA